MDLGLEGKRAFVSGGSGGIGAAIARRLGEERATVVVHGRDEARTKGVARAIEDDGGTAYAVTGPLDDDDSAARIVAAALDMTGGVDILVNNAGGFEVSGWWDTTPQRWLDVYDVNVAAPVRLIQGLVPRMKERNWGRVVQVASVSATIAPPVFPDYAAAKAATLNLSVSLAKELAGTGITVNTVSPGPVVTETWERFAQQIADAQGWDGDLEETKMRLLESAMANPARRLGRPDDVASVVAFLAGEPAGYVNGLNVKVDGGLDAGV